MQSFLDDGWQLVTHRKRSQQRNQQVEADHQQQAHSTSALQLPKLRVFRSEPRLELAGFDVYERSIVNLVTAELDQVNLSSFANFYDKFEIYQLSRPLGSDRYLPTDARLLEIGRDGRAVSMPIRYSTDKAKPGKRELVVSIRGVIVPLSIWMSSEAIGCLQHVLSSQQLEILGYDGYTVQYEWWKARGLFHDFEALPGEIQDLLLLHMIGEEVLVSKPTYYRAGHLVTLLHLNRIWLHDSCYVWACTQHEACTTPVTLAFRLNKSIRRRAMYVFRVSTVKCIRHDYFWNLTSLSEQFLRFITKLKLSFNDNEYLEFFAGETINENGDVRNWEPTAEGLGKIPALHTLELVFPSPIESAQRSDLWNYRFIPHDDDDYELPFGRMPQSSHRRTSLLRVRRDPLHSQSDTLWLHQEIDTQEVGEYTWNYVKPTRACEQNRETRRTAT